MIIFENIDTKETIGIDRSKGGKFYRAKLSAVMNSSNLSPNADRGQDFGWRLAPEQQALIEQWETDPQMIDRVSQWSKVMVDDLTHSEFLAYLLYQQELGMSPERSQDSERRQNQLDYQARVEALKTAARPVPMPAYDPGIARGEATLDDFESGRLTGDAAGDKVVEDDNSPVTEDQLAELDKVIEDSGAEAPKIEPTVVGVDPAQPGGDKTVETKPKTSPKPKANKK